jgi:hypothetical protein
MNTSLRGSSAAAVVLAAAFLAPFAAGATEAVGVLAVSEPPGPPPALVEATVQFRAVLAQHAPGVLDAAELRQRMVGQAPSTSLSELDRAHAGALATYQAGDYDGAIRTLRSVIDELEKLPDGEEAFAQWTRAMLRLARAEQTVGRRAESKAALLRLVRANPQVKVDLTQYPPSFAQQVEAAKAELAVLPKRKLSVTSSQKGVTVYVDGRQLGTAPVTVSLVPGRYRVSGATRELRIPGIQTDLSEADQVVSLDLALAGALRPDAGPGLALPREDRALKIVAAAASLGLDRVIATTTVVDADVSYLQGTLYEVRRGVMSREARVRLAGGLPPPGGLSALASFLMTGRTSALVSESAPAALPPLAIAPPAAAPETAPATPAVAAPAAPAAAAAAPDLSAPPPKDPFALLGAGERPRRSAVLQWSPVVGTGLAVGLGAFATWSALKANDSYSKANALVQNGALRLDSSPAEYNGHINDGNSARQLAAGTGIAAGVTLAASATLAYLNYRATGQFGPFGF